MDGDISITMILLIVAGVLIARLLTKQILYRVVEQALRSHKHSSEKERLQRRDTLVSVLNTVLLVLYVIVGFVMILTELGVNLTSSLASLGAIGVVLGVAGQSIIKDFWTGISILFHDQMRVGDIVEVAGKSGIVESISLMIVRLRDLDGNVHVVPNSSIEVVTNMSHGFANVNLDIRVSYDADIDKVERLINQVGSEMAKESDWESKFIKPISFYRVDDFSETAVIVKALGKVKPAEQWTVAGEFRRRIIQAFAKNKIEIPITQHVIEQVK